MVDAWVALQTLRADAIAPQARRIRYTEAVEQISLEHLMVSSAITGSPATEGGGGIAGGPGASGAVSGPTGTDSYLFSGGTRGPRSPFSLDPPARKQADHAQPITAAARWSPSWTPASGPIRGWTWHRTAAGGYTR